MIADMAIKYEATRLLVHKAAWMIDQGVAQLPHRVLRQGLRRRQLPCRCATDAVQVFGGYGYTKEYPVEKLMRDAKILQIYEGTSQIQRMVIAKNLFAGRG